MKAEGLIKGAVVDEHREEGKDVECMKLENVRGWIALGRARH